MIRTCSPCLSRCIASRPASLTSAQRRRQIVRPSTVVCGGVDYQDSLRSLCGDVCDVAICIPVAAMAIAEFEIRASLPCRDLCQPVSEQAGMSTRLDLDLLELQPKFHTGGLLTAGPSDTLVIAEHPDPPLDPKPPPKRRRVGPGSAALLMLLSSAFARSGE